jgi:molybdopterin converting factor small subunit
MNTRMFVVFLCLFMIHPFPTRAQDQLSCEELGELSDTLSELTDWITSEGEKVEEGSETDKALGKLIQTLKRVAKAETNARLDTALKALHEAWKDEDGQWEQFPATMAITTYEFDRIYYNAKCERNSDEEYTNSELSDLAYTLRQINGAIESEVKIKDESHLDLAFENLLDDLKKLVDASENEDLKKQVKILQKAWKDMDWEKFAEICDGVADAIEEL